MKALTMVMRNGVKDAPANLMSYICIGEDYSIVKLTGDEILKAMQNKKYDIKNLGIGPKGLMSINGAIDKYTLIDPITGRVEGKASPVVINRVELNGALIGYTIFNTNGVLQEVTVKDAVKIHAMSPFSNGKIRPTQDGNIIASIAGNYTLRVLEVEKTKDGVIKVDIVFVGSAVGSSKEILKYAGIFVSCENAADISKMYAMISYENKKLIHMIKDTGGDEKVTESLAIRRTGGAGVYGVFPISVVFGLIKKAGNKVQNKIGTIAVACIDYSAEGDESSVKLTKDLTVTSLVHGTERSDKALKAYLEDLIIELRKVTVI